MKVFIHRAKSRGFFSRGGLRTYHTFSFAEYFHPQRIHFGALRVLNDGTLEGGEGIGLHAPHNMEIITIPLHGELVHVDGLGNEEVLRKGHIQVMSAGTGLRHSEYNKNPDKPVQFLQIWVLPDRGELAPRYQKISVGLEPGK
ncbi:MAG: pirin family protein [Rikenellaceae bacterium]|nr:pirin family protein [Rikenellaceae bacterium]